MRLAAQFYASPPIALLALVWCVAPPAEAAPVWVDQRHIGPFMVQATFDLSPHHQLLQELPALELELRRVLALRPCSEPIELVLLADEREHRAYLAERFPAAPYRRALFVRQNGRSTVFAYQHKELAIDIRHECTHALLHADLAGLPLWLDEGLAEYFEMPANERAFGHPHLASIRWRTRLRLPINLSVLEQKDELSEMELADYRLSWCWVHFLLHGPRPASEALWSYLGDIRRGEQAGALSDRLEATLPNTEHRLANHFRGWDRLSLKKTTAR